MRLSSSWEEHANQIVTEGTRGRVLSVDNDPVAARTVARVIERCGYAVDVSTNAEDALTRLRENAYDVMVTDLQMPDRDGSELIADVWEKQLVRACILVTGMADAGMRLSSPHDEAVVGILQKPWDANELVDTVRHAVEVHRMRSQPPSIPPAGRSLLLLEDVSSEAELLQEYLREGDIPYAVTHVSRLNDALQLLSKSSFDVVLADLNLPDARGLDVVRRIRAIVPDTTLLAMTQSLDDALAARCLELGANEYMRKEDVTAPLLNRVVEHARIRRRAQSQLEELAFRDPLTGLSNPRHLRDRLALAVSRAKRLRGSCALAFIDLDQFKPVNDTLGHEAGDQVLKMVARRLDEAVRGCDTLARLGGDEFAVLFEDVSDPKMLATIVDRVLQSIAEPIQVGADICSVSASAGIALCPDSADTPEGLLRAADQSMYEAKNRGPGHFVFAKGVASGHKFERARMHDALRNAVREGELVLAFQPQLSIGSPARVVGVEALMRWRRDGKNIVPPSEFIPVLESMELVYPVGLWAIETACRQLRHWNRRRPLMERVAVNASPRQFERSSFAKDVLDRLAKLQVAPNQLEIEVTERLLLQETPVVSENLAALREHGVRIAVDDFGTGYASLAYLKRFVVDCVKIDQSFIESLDRDPASERLVAGIIDLGHRLGIEVMAEGVERFEQLRILRRLGCDTCQGYLFGKPVFALSLPTYASSVTALRGMNRPRSGRQSSPPRPVIYPPAPPLAVGRAQ